MSVRVQKSEAACLRDPLYGKDIPGLRHDGWIDPKGELVRPAQFSGFNKKLKRIHPSCELAFDRAMGWYAIVLWGREALTLAEKDGESLGYLKSTPSTVMTLKRHVMYTVDNGWLDKYLFMPPTEEALELLASIPERFMQFEQGEFISEYLTQVGEKRWRLACDARQQQISDVVSEASTVMDREGGLRPSVVVG